MLEGSEWYCPAGTALTVLVWTPTGPACQYPPSVQQRDRLTVALTLMMLPAITVLISVFLDKEDFWN